MLSASSGSMYVNLFLPFALCALFARFFLVLSAVRSCLGFVAPPCSALLGLKLTHSSRFSDRFWQYLYVKLS